MEMPDDHRREPYDSLRDPGDVHQLTGKDKQWDGEQRERIDSFHHHLREKHVRNRILRKLRQEYESEPGNANGPCDLHPDEGKEEQQSDHDDEKHGAVLVRFRVLQWRAGTGVWNGEPV